MYRIEEFEIFY